MPRKFSTWKAGRRLGARAAFVAGIFLLMSVGAVVADSHGTLGGVFHVPFAQASHSDHHTSQAQGNNSDESQSGSQTSDESGNSQGDQNGNSQGDENGNGDKDDCGNGDDQSGYQDNCDEGHSHGHHHHHGHHHGD